MQYCFLFLFLLWYENKNLELRGIDDFWGEILKCDLVLWKENRETMTLSNF